MAVSPFGSGLASCAITISGEWFSNSHSQQPAFRLFIFQDIICMHLRYPNFVYLSPLFLYLKTYSAELTFIIGRSATHMVYPNLDRIGVPVDTAAFPGVSSITPTPKNTTESIYKNRPCHIVSYSRRVFHLYFTQGWSS